MIIVSDIFKHNNQFYSQQIGIHGFRTAFEQIERSCKNFVQYIIQQ